MCIRDRFIDSPNFLPVSHDTSKNGFKYLGCAVSLSLIHIFYTIIVEPILTYGCEWWQLSDKEKKIWL